MEIPARYLALLVGILVFCGVLAAVLSTPGTPRPAAGSFAPPSPPVYAITIENGWLTMPDGVNLAVTYMRPVPKSRGETFPVLFEMLPYRKDDMFFSVDYQKGSYFAERGYIYARVDVRGTGSSGGAVPVSEYSEAELSDGVAIIDILSKMPGSNGNVGMFGKSWGGFNALMLAARKPPALKAILVAHASDDLYYNDIHFIDGVFHIDTYETQIVTDNALPAPPDYAITPEYFAERFDQKPWIFTWKEHQLPGDTLWTKESLRYRENLTVPVYFIGGLLDQYRDTIPRLMDRTEAPVKADIGPWNHIWPSDRSLGPNYEWREKATRWWDYWLKGRDTGILDEPDFMVFFRDAVPASASLTDIPGEWRCGDWPPGGIENERYFLRGPATLSRDPAGAGGAETLSYRAGSGMATDVWWGEVTGDMAADDRESLTFDSEILSDTIEIMGSPRVFLNVSADAPHYTWSVRLEDVWPDGTVSLVSGTLINPAHSFEDPVARPLVPGVPTILSGTIHYTTYTFRPGHRIRVAVSNAQFSMGWPTPYAGNTTLYHSGSAIDLPVERENTLTAACDLPVPVDTAERPGYEFLGSGSAECPCERNVTTGESVFSRCSENRWRINDTVFRNAEWNQWRVDDRHPENATFAAVRTDEVALPGRVLNLTDTYDLSSARDSFTLTLVRRLSENGVLIRERTEKETIPRQFQ